MSLNIHNYEIASKRFQQGEGPSSGLLQACFNPVDSSKSQMAYLEPELLAVLIVLALLPAALPGEHLPATHLLKRLHLPHLAHQAP